MRIVKCRSEYGLRSKDLEGRVVLEGANGRIVVVDHLGMLLMISVAGDIEGRCASAMLRKLTGGDQ